MKIYLVRHSNAVPESYQLPDSDRYLSAEGRRVARRQGTKLREAGVEFQLVLTSPLTRAVQTAELLADAVDYLDVIETLSSLRPGCQPHQAARELAARNIDTCVVGHEPTISALAAYLQGIPSFQPFRPGQVVLFENGKPAWRIKPQSDLEPQF